ncbi:hypothetical protein LUZ60_001412 [Juncus effusus]|nr:hypothetical protein LUZ60_001412 [Juncus effusus]
MEVTSSSSTPIKRNPKPAAGAAIVKMEMASSSSTLIKRNPKPTAGAAIVKMEMASSSSTPLKRNPKLTAGAGVTATAYSSSSSRISRQWSELNYDLLVSIFSRVSSTDLIVGVSSVCSSWRSAAKNPHCWRVLDLSDWDSLTARIRVPVSFNQVFNRVLRFVNGGERIEELYFPSVADEHDLLVSERLPKLVHLSFPRSKVPKMAFYSALINFKSLKGIAINYHFFVTTEVLSLSGTQFPQLFELKILSEISSDETDHLVRMVCKVFPKLRKLEMQQLFVISNKTFTRLLDSLQHLEYLDISGCKTLRIDTKVFEKAASRLKVLILSWNEDLERFAESSNWTHLLV